MKGKILGISICMLLIATAIPAVGTINKEVTQSPLGQDFVEWEQTYGGDEFDWLYCIKPTIDVGGYIAIGVTTESNVYYAWILKVDDLGNEEWSTINYEWNATDIENMVVSCVRQTTDDCFLVGGIGEKYNAFHGYPSVTGYLWKINATGSTVWLKSLDDEENEIAYVPLVFEPEHTDWICSGFYVEGTPTNFFLDVALFKTDNDGNLIWQKNIDAGGGYEAARSLCRTISDDGFFFSGFTTFNPSTQDSGIHMITTDNEGNNPDVILFDSPAYDDSYAMGCGKLDDTYIIAGNTQQNSATGQDLWILGIDETGEELWNRTYGGPNDERIYGMDMTQDGGCVFVVIKNAGHLAGTKEDTWIINTDSMGNIEWELLIEQEGIQWSQSIVQTDDKGFIVAGRTGWKPYPNSDALIFKVGAFPQLDIDIAGGVGITATITNKGDGDTTEVPWEITVTGGILGLINQTFSGTTNIASGATETVKTGLFFGLGKIQVTVTIGPKTNTAEGKHLIIFSSILE